MNFLEKHGLKLKVEILETKIRRKFLERLKVKVDMFWSQ